MNETEFQIGLMLSAIIIECPNQYLSNDPQNEKVCELCNCNYYTDYDCNCKGANLAECWHKVYKAGLLSEKTIEKEISICNCGSNKLAIYTGEDECVCEDCAKKINAERDRREQLVRCEYCKEINIPIRYIEDYPENFIKTDTGYICEDCKEEYLEEQRKNKDENT